MQNRKLILLTVLLFFHLGTMAQKTPPPFKKFLYTDKSDSLPYGILSPLKTEANKKYPLVIFLHGAGERGNDNEQHFKHIQLLFTTNTLNKFPCFVVAPQCPKNNVWSQLTQGKSLSASPTRPMKLFLELYDQILKDYPIDPARIYVTGISMGGFGTWDLLARFPDRFAAAVPICGGGDEKTAARIKHIPVWVFHGALDDIVSPALSRKMVSALQAQGAAPGYTEYPGIKHSSWYQAYKEPMLMTWLFKQTLRREN